MAAKNNFYTFITLFLISFSFTSAQRKVDFNRLDYFEGKVYMGRESFPYTGFTYDFFEDIDQKKFDGFIRNGVMDGKWTFYHANGLVKEKGHYRNADAKFLFSNVDENTIPPHKNRNGTWRQFYKDGSKYTYGRFIIGERWGMHTFYGFNNGLMVRSYFKQNLKDGYEYTFLNNRKIHTGLYQNGIQLWEPLETYNEGKVVLENPFNMPLYAPVMGEKTIQEVSYDFNSKKEPTLAKMEIVLDPGSVSVVDQDEQTNLPEKLLETANPVIVMNPEKRPVEDLYPTQDKIKSVTSPKILPMKKKNNLVSNKSDQTGYIPFRIMFRAARKAGISTFSWQGKLYNTNLRKW